MCLRERRFSDEFLAEFLVGLGVVRASVMLDCNSGVAAQLKARFLLINSAGIALITVLNWQFQKW